MTENEIGTLVVQVSIDVHRELGPGMLESVYEEILYREIHRLGLVVQRQVPLAIRYKDTVVENAFRADLIVEDKVILELKSVEEIHPSHKKQIQTYLRLAKMKLGYLLNFGAPLMKSGILRCVNGLQDKFFMVLSRPLPTSAGWHKSPNRPHICNPPRLCVSAGASKSLPSLSPHKHPAGCIHHHPSIRSGRKTVIP